MKDVLNNYHCMLIETCYIWRIISNQISRAMIINYFLENSFLSVYKLAVLAGIAYWGFKRHKTMIVNRNTVSFSSANHLHEFMIRIYYIIYKKQLIALNQTWILGFTTYPIHDSNTCGS